MSEATLTCRIHEKYYEIECANPALIGDPEGLCILHSKNKSKDPAGFRQAVLEICYREDVEFFNFLGIFFPGPFNPEDFFGTFEFHKAVDFSWATFADEVDFCGATFEKEADFASTFFMGEAYFSDATFIENAVFSLATFAKTAHFSRTIFKEDVDFSYTRFSKESTFLWTKFNKEAYFSGARIEGLLVFRSINVKRKDKEQLSQVFIGTFKDLDLIEGGILRFQDLSLAQARFFGTDLRQADFYHVHWHYYRLRHALYDEILLRQDEKMAPWFWTWFLYHFPYSVPPSLWRDRYGEIERLYRNLQDNYKQAGDYKNLGDFHYGEMEMHRRASKWGWFPFSWYYLYRFLSGYGERPSWALGWLVVFLVGMAGLVWGLGLKVANPPHIANFDDSFIYLLQKATLQRPTWAEPMGFLGKLIAGFSVLLIPGQAALFLLALRNRLGRRR